MERKLSVAGCRAEVDDPEGFYESVTKVSQGKVEVYDASVILGKEHLEVAWENAARTFADKRNHCDSLQMEARLIASGERQIKMALAKTGVKEGKVSIALASEDAGALETVIRQLSLERDDSVIEPTEEKLVKFGITRQEMAAIGTDAMDIVFERMALMEVERGK